MERNQTKKFGCREGFRYQTIEQNQQKNRSRSLSVSLGPPLLRARSRRRPGLRGSRPKQAPSVPRTMMPDPETQELGAAQGRRVGDTLLLVVFLATGDGSDRLRGIKRGKSNFKRISPRRWDCESLLLKVKLVEPCATSGVYERDRELGRGGSALAQHDRDHLLTISRPMTINVAGFPVLVCVWPWRFGDIFSCPHRHDARPSVLG